MKRNRVGLGRDQAGSSLRRLEPECDTGSSEDEGKRLKKATSHASPTPQDTIFVHLSQEGTPPKCTFVEAPAPPPAPSKGGSSAGPHAKHRVFSEPFVWSGSPDSDADSEGEASPTPHDAIYVHLSQEGTPQKSPRVGKPLCLRQVVPIFRGHSCFEAFCVCCVFHFPSVTHGG